MFNYIKELIVKRIFAFEGDKVLMLNKVPFVMLPSKGMARFIQEASELIGDEKLENIGFNAGTMVANDFIDNFSWSEKQLPGRMASIKNMFQVMGFGNLDIQKWDSKNNKFLVRITSHPVIEHAGKMYKEKEKACKFYMAIYSAHLQKEMKINNCHLIETQCACKGAKFCEWSYNVFNHKKDKK